MDRRAALKNTALLVGITMGTSAISGLLKSCQRQNRLEWKPRFFNEEQASVVSEITETILPRTETPGAKDLKVDIFVDLMFQKNLGPEDQQHVMKGYARFVEVGQELFGKSFTDMDNTQRTQVLQKIEKETNTFNPAIWGTFLGEQPPIDFYRRLKQFTLLGYFTSKELTELSV